MTEILVHGHGNQSSTPEIDPKLNEQLLYRLSQEDQQTLEVCLDDPFWRINNLYTIVDKNGKRIPFVPNKPQTRVLEDLYIYGKRRQAILKARQLGFSTLIEIILLDLAIWHDDHQVSIVADTADNAKKLLRLKSKFAFDQMPADFRRGVATLKANESVLEFENGSSITAGTRQRSGTNQALHVSEWGKVANKDPERSTEIKTGALPTVPKTGIIFVESTFEGGRGGDFYKLLRRAMDTPEEHMTDLDFHFQFFPWFEDPEYRLEGDMSQIDDATWEYFDELTEETGVEFDDEQVLWYYKMAEEQGMLMGREYPSTPEEAFAIPVEGAIWAEEISKIRRNKQVVDWEVDENYPIFTSWDIGHSNYTCIWWWQIIGQDICFIDHHRGFGQNAAHYAKVCAEKPWSVHTHYLPHDAAAKRPGSGMSYIDHLITAGQDNNRTLKMTGDRWIGINEFKSLIKRMWFHKTRCATDYKIDGEEEPSGLTCLESYRMKWQDKESIYAKEPVHDWASDDADAARYFAEAYREGIIPYKSPRTSDYQPENIKKGKAKSAYHNRTVRGRRRR